MGRWTWIRLITELQLQKPGQGVQPGWQVLAVRRPALLSSRRRLGPAEGLAGEWA
jgi:hypothetical protein